MPEQLLQKVHNNTTKIAVLETKMNTVCHDIGEIKDYLKNLSADIQNGKGSFIKAILTSGAAGAAIMGIVQKFLLH